jgi:TolA-binding protein
VPHISRLYRKSKRTSAIRLPKSRGPSNAVTQPPSQRPQLLHRTLQPHTSSYLNAPTHQPSKIKTATMPSRTALYNDPGAPSDSAYLSSSLSSLSRSRSSNNLIVRTYKQATQLYLTRRFREAWDVLETIVNAGSQDDGDNGGGQSHGIAPVAQSSRGTRTKVWVFYLSLIHAVVEMGAEEGAREFGGADAWRAVARKAREGLAWEEIVGRGYAGQEGEVDAEVVVNLATLLLGHMPDQRANQARLESYLASSEDAGAVVGFYDGVSTPMSTHSSSPKALQARVKVLELYALHVLPEVGEWEYAREFVEGCGNLDEERKEAFLAALEGLKEEREGLKRREVELQEQRDREAQEELRRREQVEQKRVEEAERERQRHEQQQKETAAKTASNTATAAASSSNIEPRTSALNDNNTNSNTPPNNHPRSTQPSRSARKPPPNSQQPTAANATTLLTRLTSLAHHLRRSLGPSLLNARLLIFFFAFLLLAARRDFRVRLRRALGEAWAKVRRTVGMGVKVSYV